MAFRDYTAWGDRLPVGGVEYQITQPFHAAPSSPAGEASDVLELRGHRGCRGLAGQRIAVCSEVAARHALEQRDLLGRQFLPPRIDRACVDRFARPALVLPKLAMMQPPARRASA